MKVGVREETNKEDNNEIKWVNNHMFLGNKGNKDKEQIDNVKIVQIIFVMLEIEPTLRKIIMYWQNQQK
jgi:hypothetical protein